MRFPIPPYMNTEEEMTYFCNFSFRHECIADAGTQDGLDLSTLTILSVLMIPWPNPFPAPRVSQGILSPGPCWQMFVSTGTGWNIHLVSCGGFTHILSLAVKPPALLFLFLGNNARVTVFSSANHMRTSSPDYIIITAACDDWSNGI